MGKYGFGKLPSLTELTIKVYDKGEWLHDEDVANLSKEVKLMYINSKDDLRKSGEPPND